MTSDDFGLKADGNQTPSKTWLGFVMNHIQHTHTVTDSRALTNTSPLNPPTITLHSLSFDHNTAQPCVYYTPTLLFYGKHILLLGGYNMLSLQVEEIHCNKAEKNEIHHTKLKQISKLDTRQVT